MSTADSGNVRNDWESILHRHRKQLEERRQQEREALLDSTEDAKKGYMAKLSQLAYEHIKLRKQVDAVAEEMVRTKAAINEIEDASAARLGEMQKAWALEDEERRKMEESLNQADTDTAGEDGSASATLFNGTTPEPASDEQTAPAAVDAEPAGDAMDLDHASQQQQQQQHQGVPVRAKPGLLAAPALDGGNVVGRTQSAVATGSPLQTPPIPTVEVQGEDIEDATTGGFTAVNASVSRKQSRSASVSASVAVQDEASGSAPPEKKPRRSLPDGSRRSLPDGKPREAPLNRRFVKSPSGSDAGTPRADESDAGPGLGDADGPHLPEITRSTLALQHDGQVYTAPDLMMGVPVRKIDENDPYWDPEWVPLIPKIQESLSGWERKYEMQTLAAANPTEGKRTKHAQFLANRQVNRGRAILEFLCARGSEEAVGGINPYQLVGKQFINSTYTGYDVLYRLVATLSELKKFSLDVTPIEWVRQRLHEIHSEYPLGFQLSKVVGELYHDPKLQALRAKNGFGNIGRPSGTGSKGRGRPSASFAAAGAPTGTETPGMKGRASKAEKRKEPHVTPRGTPTKILPMPTAMPLPMPMQLPPHIAARPPIPMPMPAPPGTGFMRMALNPIEPNPGPAPYSLQAQPNVSTAPSEAVQSYREAIRRTQQVVYDFQRRAEQDKSAKPSPQPPPSQANKKARLEVSPQPAPSQLPLPLPTPPRPAQPEAAPKAALKAAPKAEPDSESEPEPTPEPALRPEPTKLPSTVLRINQDDTHHDGYTSVDSYSGDAVMMMDWRVSVVKTSERSSGTDITQYWHWVDAGQVDDESEGDFFEHQVLSELKPPDWGVYKDPINFHLRLAELEAVVFAPGSLRIVVRTIRVPNIEYRGDVLAEFKRERTKRRLLKFMKKKEVKLIKTNAAYINSVWNRVNPVILPGDDDSGE